jgi:hypothetical protein
MERSSSKQTNEPPKRQNHKGNMKFPNPLLVLRQAYQIRKMELSQRSMSICQNRLYMKRREKVSITYPKKTSACAFLQQKKRAATTKSHLTPTTLALASSDMNDTRHKEHLIFSFYNTHQLTLVPKWYNA